MKRILIYVLLFANLASGIAFAWDAHAGAVLGDEWIGQSVAAGTGDGQPAGDVHEDDHCCHGASHFSGVLADHSASIEASVGVHISQALSVLSSLAISPPRRPPIL